MNAFEQHGIDHLSASSCNLFAAEPALWVMERLLKKRAPVGPAAHRGTAVEAGAAKAITENAAAEECLKETRSVFRTKTALSGDPRIEKEAANLEGMLEQATAALAPYGNDVRLQEKISWSSDQVSVPFIGYIDFYWPDHGILVDLKTTGRMPSSIRRGHARQVALYAGALGDNIDARVCYATNAKHAVYGLENARQHAWGLEKIGATMERFLSVSRDAEELAHLLVPNLDSFYWSDATAKQNAFDVWGL